MMFYIRSWLNILALRLALLRAWGALREALTWTLSWLILPALAIGFVIYHLVQLVRR